MDINVILALPAQRGEGKSRPGNSACTCVPTWGEAEGWPCVKHTSAHGTKKSTRYLSLSSILTAAESPAESP